MNNVLRQWIGCVGGLSLALTLSLSASAGAATIAIDVSNTVGIPGQDSRNGTVVADGANLIITGNR